MPNWRIKSLGLIVVAAATAGCFPVPYSYELTGTVVDDAGQPIQGASVISVVYKSCGSLGGSSSQRLKRSVVKTGPDGQYRDRISGVSVLHFEGISACLGYEHHTVACKAGFQPSTPARSGGRQELRLTPGVGWSYLELPPECSAARVISEAQARLPVLPQLPAPTTGTLHIPLWDRAGDLIVQFADPADHESPSVGVKAFDSGEYHWLVVREQITGGRPYREAHIYRGQGYSTITGFNSIDINNTYVFLLRKSARSTPLFDKTRKVETAAGALHLEPSGGVRWTVTASGHRRTGERIKPTVATKDDWIPLREAIVEMNGKAAAKGIALHVPTYELSADNGAVAADVKSLLIQPTGKRMTLPLWAKREWTYPTVLDPGGPGAPYPSMPVVTIEGPQYRLIAVEHTQSDGTRDTEISVVSGEFFFTKNFAVKDGQYRTCIFDLAKPEPTATPLNAMGNNGGPSVSLQPRGGIAWDLAVKNSKREGSPLLLASATKEDWNRIRPNIVEFAKRRENSPYQLFDPAPAPIKKTIPTWVAGHEIFPEIFDPGPPSIPLIKIPYYHRMGWGWITISEKRSGVETTVQASRSRESDYVSDQKLNMRDGSLTVYVFPTYLARPGSKPLIDFPDKPVQFNEGGMVFSRAEACEPMGGLKWTLRFRNGKRIGEALKITPVGPEAWHKFHPQLVKLNEELSAVRQQYLQVIFDPPLGTTSKATR